MRDELKRMIFVGDDLLEQGRHAQAIKAYKSALECAEKDHEEEYFALSYLGMAYDDANQPKQAIPVFKKAQALAAKLFGKDSRPFAASLTSEGMVHANRGDVRVAEPILDEAVVRLQAAGSPKLHEPKHVTGTAVDVLANAADCKAKLGKLPEAVALMKRAYKVAKSVLPKNDPRRVQTSLELGTLLVAVGDDREAERLAQEALSSLSGKNPLQYFEAFMEATINGLAMLEGVESAQFAPAASSDNLSASNVVPLFSKSEPRAAADKCAGYQLKITLKRVKPPIWRRVVVPADYSLSELHDVIQTAMGWSDDHLHEFRIGSRRFGDLDRGSDAQNERRRDLRSFRFEEGSKFEYEYDFGDGWEHTILIEKLLNQSQFEESRVFVTGKGACPPEDCGGPFGFMHLLDALRTQHRRKLPEWLQEYDPELLPDCFESTKSTKKKRSKGAAALARSGKPD